MKSGPYGSCLLWGSVLFVVQASAGEITPEARAFLEKLHEKVASIETLSWEITGHPWMVATTCSYTYKKGGHLKITRTIFSFCGPDEAGSFGQVVTPDSFVPYQSAAGLLSPMAPEVLQLFCSEIWFALPLLNEKTLGFLGDVSLESKKEENVHYAVLRIALTSAVTTGSEQTRSLVFYFEPENLRLAQWALVHSPFAIPWRKITSYQKLGDYDFPIASEDESFWERPATVREIKLNPPLTEPLFGSEVKGALTYDSSLEEAEIRERLARAATPLEQASLHCSLGLLYQKRGQRAAINEFRKVIEICPEAMAGYFALSDALQLAQEKSEAASLLKRALKWFPESRDLAYQNLVWLYAKGPQRAEGIEEALKWARAWVSDAPNSYQPLKSLGMVFRQKGDFAEAAKAYEQASALLGVAQSIKDHDRLTSALLYVQQGKKEEAAKVLLSLTDQKENAAGLWVRKEAEQRLMAIYKDQGKLDAVLEETLTVLEESPDNLNKLMRLYAIYALEGETDKTLDALERIMDAKPSCFFTYYQSDLSSTVGQTTLPRWIAVYVKALRKSPAALSPYRLESLLGLYRRAGQLEEAKQFLAECLGELPDNPQYPFAGARFYESAGKTQEALGLYRRAVESARTESEKHTYRLSLMWAYKNAGKLEEAIKVGSEYAESSGGGQGYAQLAQMLQQAGKLDEAMAAYQEAIKNATVNENVYHIKTGLINLYLQANRPQLAEPLAKELLRSAKPSYEKKNAAELLGRALTAAGDVNTVISGLEKQVAENPNDQDSLLLLAGIFRSRGDGPKAADLYRKLVALQPSVENYQEWINALSQAREHGEAIEAYKEFFQKHPDQKQNHSTSFIDTCQKVGKLDEAIPLARELAETALSPQPALQRLADLLQQAKRYDEAPAIQKRLLDLAQDDQSLWQARGSIAAIYQDQGKLDEAIQMAEEWAKAASDKGRAEEASRLVIELQKKAGRVDAFIKDLEMQIEADPKNENLLWRLAEICAQRLDWDKVAEVYRKLVEMDRNRDSGVYYVLASSLSKAGKKEEAVQAWEELIAKFPDVKLNYLQDLTTDCREAGKLDKAIATAKDYTRIYPSYGYAFSQLASLLAEAKQYDKAIKTYRAAVERETQPELRHEYKRSIARIYQAQGKAKKAETLARYLAKTAPNDYSRQQASELLSELLRSAGRAEEFVK